MVEEHSAQRHTHTHTHTHTHRVEDEKEHYDHDDDADSFSNGKETYSKEATVYTCVSYHIIVASVVANNRVAIIGVCAHDTSSVAPLGSVGTSLDCCGWAGEDTIMVDNLILVITSGQR